jgi:hypothetical protein
MFLSAAVCPALGLQYDHDHLSVLNDEAGGPSALNNTLEDVSMNAYRTRDESICFLI